MAIDLQHDSWAREIKYWCGSVAHPMIPQHYIQFVVLETKIGENTYWHLKNLNPGEAPEAEFVLAEGEKPLGAYEYCNLHGLWLTEL